MKKIILFSFICLGIAGCAGLLIEESPYKVVSESSLEGYTRKRTEGNIMAVFKDGNCKFQEHVGINYGPIIKLNLIAIEDTKSKPRAAFEVEFRAPANLDSSWIFIREEDSLTFYFGREKRRLSTKNVQRKTFEDFQEVCISEVAVYFIALDELQKVLASNDLKFRLDGKETYMEGCVPEFALNNLKKFASAELQVP
jgi:hypothetical protein